MAFTLAMYLLSRPPLDRLFLWEEARKGGRGWSWSRRKVRVRPAAPEDVLVWPEPERLELAGARGASGAAPDSPPGPGSVPSLAQALLLEDDDGRD